MLVHPQKCSQFFATIPEEYIFVVSNLYIICVNSNIYIYIYRFICKLKMEKSIYSSFFLINGNFYISWYSF